MHRNKIVSFTAGVLMFFPVIAFAQTSNIQVLQQQIAALQQQLTKMQQVHPVPPQLHSVPPTPVGDQEGDQPPAQTVSFDRDLSFGMRNDADVSNLQEFLTDQGFYSSTVSGNYFLLTQSGVKKFQASHNIRASGYFGPVTRAIANKILAGIENGGDGGSGGGGVPRGINNAPQINGFPAVPTNIQPGQDVSFSWHATDADNDNLSWSIDWGDGSGAAGACEVSLSSRTNSTSRQINNSELASSWSFFQSHTWSNAGAYTVKATVSDCKGGTNAHVFVVLVGQTSGNLPPVIYGIKGPTALRTGETGTWTIQASDPENGTLSYMVSWGDEESKPVGLPMSSGSVRQTATFTHVYGRAGTFTPVFTVYDSAGLSSQTSASVSVGSLSTRAGSLSIDPTYATIKVGESVQVRAMFTDPRPSCLDSTSTPRCMVPDRLPYEVNASFESSNPGVAAVDVLTPECAQSPPGVQPACGPVQYRVRGVSAGETIITAYYYANENSTAKIYPYKAQMKVVVTGVVNGSMTLTAPNGGETWTKGTTQTIQWQDNTPFPTPPPCPVGTICPQPSVASRLYVYDIKLVPYDYYPSCTGTVCPKYSYRAPYTIAKGVYGYSYNWSVGKVLNTYGTGDTASDGPYTIEICQTGSTTCDSSDSYFKIVGSSVQPSITVLSPNGGEQYQAGQNGIQMPLRWSASCAISSFTMALYKSGNFVQTINSSVPAGLCSAGQQTIPYYTTWAIPATLPAGNDYKVRISSVTYDTGGVSDDSDAPFSIVSNQPSITITYPQADYSLYNGLGKGDGTPATNPIATITWTSSNLASFPIEIDLLNTSGSIVKIIATGLQNTGSYRWLYDSTIPSGKYTLLVSSQIQEGTPGSSAGRSGTFSIVSDLYSVQLLPDLAVTRMTIDPAIPVVGKPALLIIDVTNKGSTTANSINFSTDVGYQGVVTAGRGNGCINGISLTPYEICSIVLSVTYSSASIANTVRTQVDIDNSVRESDESNNSMTLSFPISLDQSKMQILSPNGGETLVKGQSATISWTGGYPKVLDSNSVALQLQRPDGSQVGWISFGNQPSGTFTWDPAKVMSAKGYPYNVDVPDGQYKVAAIDYNSTNWQGPGVNNTDQSDGVFTIATPIATLLQSPRP